MCAIRGKSAGQCGCAASSGKGRETRKEKRMFDAIIMIGLVVGASLQIQAVWDMSRTPYEGEDKLSVQAQAMVLAAAGSVCALGALTAALLATMAH